MGVRLAAELLRRHPVQRLHRRQAMDLVGVEPAFEDVARQALEVLEMGIIVLAPDLGRILYRNRRALDLVGPALPDEIVAAIRMYIVSRSDTGRSPPAMRLVVGERVLFLRVSPSPGHPACEIALLREEVLRDADAYRLLNARYGVTRAEYRVLMSLRLGKTNREIATELGLKETAAAGAVHRLLARFDAPNRTRLVHIIERLLIAR